ncbi:hypothetical protein D3C71_1860660 [compost metagenome]
MHWRLFGSVCISGPASRLPQPKLETLVQMLLTTANQLSYALTGTKSAEAVRTSHWHP